VALAIAVTDGSLAGYLQYDRQHHGRDATDFLSNSIVAACMLADVEPLCTLGVSDCDQLALDEYASPQTVMVTKSDMRDSINLVDGTRIDVPRHYGDFLKSREKNLWASQMEVEIQRLLSIPVAKLIHKSQIPADATGPYRTQWAFDYREGNIAKGALKQFRPRVAVGHPLKDGIDSENDAISTFATSGQPT
jgi:hypothetical protein